jgi:hypothetical protein
MKYYIISTPEQFLVETEKNFDCYDHFTIVAEHATKDEAEAALNRAQELEKLLRPGWMAAIEHTERLRNMMLQAVWSAAKPIGQEKGFQDGV